MPTPGDRATRPLVGPVEPPALHVMTWNLRRRVGPVLRPRADHWEHRRHRVRQVLATEVPSVLGLQEVLADQAQWVLDSLPGYELVGHGRLPGGDEGTPIVFDPRRLELLGHDQWALSPTPRVPGSRGHGNLIPRIVTEAHLGDRATGCELAVLCTHLDPFSARSRRAAVTMLGARAASTGVPTLLLGDFNTGTDSPEHRALERAGLRNAWDLAQRRTTPRWGTYSRYRAPGIGRQLDWVMVGPGVSVHEVGVSTHRWGGAAASDHWPVHARLTLEDGSP